MSGDTRVSVRLSDDELAKLDRARGQASRAEYLRALLRDRPEDAAPGVIQAGHVVWRDGSGRVIEP